MGTMLYGKSYCPRFQQVYRTIVVARSFVSLSMYRRIHGVGTDHPSIATSLHRLGRILQGK